jgi:hypothetical protein
MSSAAGSCQSQEGGFEKVLSILWNTNRNAENMTGVTNMTGVSGVGVSGVGVLCVTSHSKVRTAVSCACIPLPLPLTSPVLRLPNSPRPTKKEACLLSDTAVSLGACSTLHLNIF